MVQSILRWGHTFLISNKTIHCTRAWRGISRSKSTAAVGKMEEEMVKNCFVFSKIQNWNIFLLLQRKSGLTKKKLFFFSKINDLLIALETASWSQFLNSFKFVVLAGVPLIGGWWSSLIYQYIIKNAFHGLPLFQLVGSLRLGVDSHPGGSRHKNNDNNIKNSNDYSNDNSNQIII